MTDFSEKKGAKKALENIIETMDLILLRIEADISNTVDEDVSGEFIDVSRQIQSVFKRFLDILADPEERDHDDERETDQEQDVIKGEDHG
ncbi:MAG: hypothetical protein GY729_06510 [Desulfobacteraceae bacterium]|nr:hypothetical protein [Desulfobacteraceae bacterium]